jgi:hypothetical protein
MGSPRQPLRASPNGLTQQQPQPQPSSVQASRDAAALSGASLAFIKSLPPREALKYLDKHYPPASTHHHSKAASHEEKAGSRQAWPDLIKKLPEKRAASRATSSTHSKPHRDDPPQPVVAHSGNGSRASPDKLDKLDQTSIAPTSSLVELFERNDPRPPPTITIALRSPQPLRKTALIYNQTIEPRTTRLAGNIKHDDYSSSDDAYESARDHLSPQKPAPPISRSVRRSDSKAQLTKPMPVVRNYLIQPDHPSITATYHQLYPRRMTPLKSGDSLANAIVASSLASHRAPSPTKLPPPDQQQTSRRSSHHSLTTHFFNRTPSPVKKGGMRQTMRKPASDTETDEDGDPYSKHKKKRFVRKHPNKHHEGDRKRWRDTVTQTERKRYEGVWAANKGICIDDESTRLKPPITSTRPVSKESERSKIHDQFPSVCDQVSDIVVRDIWQRSRLPLHELEQVWDLVDNQQQGRLCRDEFVVGLWLIDQRLKGRKLPVKVTDSVWNSVRLLSGIKLRKP